MVSNEPSHCAYDSQECKALPGMEPIDESSESPQRLKMFNYLSGLTRAVGALLLILVVAWIGQYRDGFGSGYNVQSNFNWHPMLMILGMVFLHSNGMLIYRTQRTIGMQRLKAIHTGIMIVCMICAIIGLNVGFQYHNAAGGGYFPDMYTLHSWVGLITVVLFFAQCVAGFYTIYYPGVGPELQATYRWWQAYLGPKTFVGAIIACLLGFNEKAIFILHGSSDYLSENTMIWFIYLTLIAFGGLSVYLVSEDRFKRLSKPGDDDPMTKEAVFGNLCAQDEPICCLPWTPNDCARLCQISSSQPHSNALQTVGTHSPPMAVATPPLNNLKDVD